jgi:hypothetical protein
MREALSLDWDMFDGVWIGFESSPVLYLSIKDECFSPGKLVPEVFVDLLYQGGADEYDRSDDGKSARFWWD